MYSLTIVGGQRPVPVKLGMVTSICASSYYGGAVFARSMGLHQTGQGFSGGVARTCVGMAPGNPLLIPALPLSEECRRRACRRNSAMPVAAGRRR